MKRLVHAPKSAAQHSGKVQRVKIRWGDLKYLDASRECCFELVCFVKLKGSSVTAHQSLSMLFV